MTFRKTILAAAFLLCASVCRAQLDVVSFTVSDGISDSGLKASIESNVSRMLSVFNATIIEGKTKLKFEKADEQTVFTKEGLSGIEELWSTSAMMCPVSQVVEKCVSMQNGNSQARNIPITMLAADDDDAEQELVVCFNALGQIDNVMIAMEEHRYVDVISANIGVKDLHQRQTIVDFVENFRTAYNRKDLDYISDVFSDNALIITGKVVKVQKQNDLTSQSLTTEQIQYQKSTKTEYITNLKKCFKNNSYINLKFDEIEVMRHPKRSDVYGVTLKQHWNSSNYSDVGYLFLMINFEDELNPSIQVRTWQPDKYNGKPLPREEVFSLDMFNI